MKNIATKVDGSSTVDASELNSGWSEQKNLVNDTGQTLSAADDFQTSKAMAVNASGADFYKDSGVANVYVVSKPGTSSLRSPPAYFDGMSVRFRPANDNTGASTINVAGVGVVAIKKPDGVSDLAAGDLSTIADVIVRYDLANTAFKLFSSSVEATTEVKGVSFLPLPITLSIGSDADHDIDSPAGNFIFSGGDGSAHIGAFTKQIDSTWAQGTNTGGMASAISPAQIDTWYHYFALSDAGGSVVDFGFDTSVTAVNLLADASVIAAGLTKYSLIESVLTGDPVSIKAFQHVGDIMLFSEPILDFSGSSSTTSVLQIISSPLGRIVEAMMNARGESDLITYLSSPGVADVAPSTTVAPLGSFGGSSTSHNQVNCLTDTSSQIRRRSVSVDTLRIVTYGWRKT